jgi:REP element-mobilizing transposase RayT
VPRTAWSTSGIEAAPVTARRHRRSVRLPAFDYGSPGAYFVTICNHQRALLFSTTEYAGIVTAEWARSAELRAEIELDAFVVMPNHIHGIVWITDQADRVGARGLSPLPGNLPRGPSRTLGAFVSGYKSSVTREINALRGTPRAPVWQRNYYEHVIRNEAALNRVRRYIEANPLRWAFDRENVAGTPDRAERDFWDSLEGASFPH